MRQVTLLDSGNPVLIDGPCTLVGLSIDSSDGLVTLTDAKGPTLALVTTPGTAGGITYVPMPNIRLTKGDALFNSSGSFAVAYFAS